MSAAAYAGGAFIELHLEGADVVNRELEDIEKELRDFKKLAKTIGDAFGVKIDVKDLKKFTAEGKRAKEAVDMLQKELAKTGHSAKHIDKIDNELGDVTREARRAARAVKKVGTEAKKAGDSGAGGLARLGKNLSRVHYAIRVFRNGLWAVQFFAGWTFRSAVAADKLKKAAGGLGVAFKNMQVLSFAAEQSGATQEDMIRTMQHMQRNLSLATLKGGEYAEALSWIKMEAKDFAGLAPERKFEIIADAVANTADKGEALALAERLMGEGARQMMPLLMQGADGLRAYGQQAKSLGIILTDEAGANIEKFMDSLNMLKRFFQGLFQQIAAKIAPVLQDAITWFIAFTHTLFGGSDGFSDFGETAAAVTSGVVEALKFLLRTAQRVFSGLMMLWHGARAGVALAAGMIARVTEGLASALENFFSWTGQTKKAAWAEQLGDSAKAIREDMQKEFNEQMDLSHSFGGDAFGTAFGDRLNDKLDEIREFMNFDFSKDGEMILKPSQDMKKVASQMDFKAMEFGVEALGMAQKIQVDKQIELLGSIDKKLDNPIIMGAF
jgi:hypothetical protein